MQIINVEQGSDEWLSLRRTKITATDMPKIARISPWGTPLTLYNQKKGLSEEQFVTDSMKEGKKLEPFILSECNKRLGRNFEPAVGLQDYFAMASFDGVDFTAKEIVEIKFANKNDHDFAKKCMVPEKYYPQVQWQLFVSGYEKCMYASYNKASDDLVIFPVKRNEDAIKYYVSLAIEFFKKLHDNTPPEAENYDVVLHEEFDWADLVYSFKIAEQAVDEAEKKLKKAKDDLIEYVKNSKDNDKNFHAGCGISMNRIKRKGSIKFEEIPEVQEVLKKIDVELYRADSSSYWKISVEK